MLYTNAACLTALLCCASLVNCRSSARFAGLGDRVAHYTFPHTLPGEESLSERIVVLHVYMTWRTVRGEYHMRGAGFVDAVATRGFLSTGWTVASQRSTSSETAVSSGQRYSLQHPADSLDSDARNIFIATLFH